MEGLGGVAVYDYGEMDYLKYVKDLKGAASPLTKRPRIRITVTRPRFPGSAYEYLRRLKKNKAVRTARNATGIDNLGEAAGLVGEAAPVIEDVSEEAVRALVAQESLKLKIASCVVT